MKVILRAVLLTTAVMFFSGPVFSQNLKRAMPTPQKQPQAKTMVVRVLVADTQMGLPDARVSIINMNGAITGPVRSADADGTVSFELADGAYIVHAGKPGFRQTDKEIEKTGYTIVSISLMPDEDKGVISPDVIKGYTLFSAGMCSSAGKELSMSELCGTKVPISFRVREPSSMSVSNATIVYVKEIAGVTYAVTGVTDIDGVASLDMPDVSPPIDFLVIAEGYRPVRFSADERLDVSAPPANVFLSPLP